MLICGLTAGCLLFGCVDLAGCLVIGCVTCTIAFGFVLWVLV